MTSRSEGEGRVHIILTTCDVSEGVNGRVTSHTPICGKAEWTAKFTSPTRGVWQDE